MRSLTGHWPPPLQCNESCKNELLQLSRCVQNAVLLSSMLQVVAREVWDRVRLKSDIGPAVSQSVFLHLQSPMGSWLACC